MSAQGPVRATDKENTKLDWETPRPFFQWRNSIWKFDFDAAASAKNSLLDWSFFGPGSPHLEDALEAAVDWTIFGTRFWCNPPYGSGMEAWLEAFERQAANGAFIEALLPANTDTQWFSRCHKYASEIELLTGRVQFWYDGKPMPGGANTSGSMLVRWRRGAQGATISLSKWKGWLDE